MSKEKLSITLLLKSFLHFNLIMSRIYLFYFFSSCSKVKGDFFPSLLK